MSTFEGSAAVVGLGDRPGGRLGRMTHLPRRVLVAAVLLALTIGAALSGELAGGRSSAPARAHRIAREGLLSLPLAGQGPVSATIGADSRAYLIHGSAGGFTAWSRAQGLSSSFASLGVSVSAGATHIELAVAAVGYGSTLQATGVVAPRASANRVTYPHPGLDEWYANGPLGLEQGFTIARAPAGHSSSPLTIALALSGNARAMLAKGGRSILLRHDGGPTLRYTGLTAADARGHALHGWLTVESGRLLMHVDAAGARYPVRIDPFIQQGEKLTGGGETENEEGGPEFGTSVALSSDGNTALIGATFDGEGVGAAWVFTRSGSTWTQQGSKLTGSGESGDAFFGESVALSSEGNTALIGGGSDNSGTGAAWVFTRSGEKWTQQGSKLTGTGESGAALFGYSVALSASGNMALIGGWADNGSAGAAWVFTRSGEKWTQEGAKLTGSGETGAGEFGGEVALSAEGNYALIGGDWDNGGVGAAWVFTRSGETWKQQGSKLTGSGEVGEGHFASSVSLSEAANTALIGGWGDNSEVGAAWVFTRSGETWKQQGSKLTGSGESGAGVFGSNAALSGSGNTAVIGGPHDNGEVGAAWEFTRSGEKWTQQGSKLTGGGEVPDARFGWSVALSSNANTALIGGPEDDSDIGAAWVFFAGPATTTGSATEVTPSTATVNAIVNPNGEEVSTCKFEYGTTPSYGSHAECATLPGKGTSPVAVSAPLSSLTANTTYHFRIVATSAGGTSYGADQTLTTLATSNTGKTEESKPAKAKDGELSAEASGGTGSVTIGPYGSEIGGPGLRTSDGKYLDVYRSTSATFSKIEFKDCELGGAQTIWWYDPSAGWLPISGPTAVYTETPKPCITVTITSTSTPDVAQMTGMRYGVGEAPGLQEYGKCVAQKKGNYTEGACLTVAEKNSQADHKGHFEWLPAPQLCYAKKHGRYAESACATVDEKKGKPKGKYEAGSDAFSASSGAVKLEVKTLGLIECESSFAQGTLTGLKTGSETLTLTGCKHESAQCTSASEPAGTIRSAPLASLLYEENKKYFTDLAGSPIASFACGSTELTLSGEAGGETSGALNTMSATSQTVFKSGAGYQALKAQKTSGSSLEATLTATATTTGAEAFELAER